MKRLFLKILSWYARKYRPYWCNWCPRRYKTEWQFHEHYVKCPEKIAGIARARAEREKAIEKIAPVNREQRRKMAKKAGAIKDWGKLNA